MKVKEFKNLKGDMMEIGIHSYHGLFTSEEAHKASDKKLRTLERYLDDHDISFSEKSGLAGPRASIEGLSLKEVLKLLEDNNIEFDEVRISFYLEEKDME